MKGQLSVSLTWIFAVISGFILFAFLIYIATTQISGAQYAQSVGVLTAVDNQITSAAKEKNSVRMIETELIRLQNLCDDPESSGLLLEGASRLIPKYHQPIFSQDILEGREFIAWTQDFTVGTSIDRLLYLASPETLFIVIRNPDSRWQEIAGGMPDSFEVAFLDWVEIEEYSRPGYSEYRFVFFNQTEEELASLLDDSIPLPEGEMTAVNINTTGKEAEYYEMEDFFVKIARVDYYSDQFVYGAIFSEDAKHYSCNVGKTMQRLETISKINRNRTLEIMEEMASRSPGTCTYPDDMESGCHECIFLMSNLPELYEELGAAAENKDFGEIGRIADELEVTRADLIKGRSCPTL